MNALVQEICHRYDQDPHRMMDILIELQDRLGYIDQESIHHLAEELDVSRAEVEQTLSFYHFFHTHPAGKHRLYLNDSAVSLFHGRREVVAALEEEAGCKFGQVSPDGLVGLFDTACIGMSDQEVGAIVDDIVFPGLDAGKARRLIQELRSGKGPREIAGEWLGDASSDPGPEGSLVRSNIRERGPLLDSGYQPGESLKKALELNPDGVLGEVRTSAIRGRGGAGFPTALKWDLCRKTPARVRYVFCNADEGEPGTFKDRVILSEFPGMLFEGMIIAGYTVGSNTGILYLRYEYRYMRSYLEGILADFRSRGFLGKNILGVSGFDFDIRIQLGAGAYVCGEESALIESAEGKRGEPRDRPPFPVQKGYLDQPTVVNNVETFCSVVRILEKGGSWFASLGTKDSTGTKLLSISGDCDHPGVYELEWGFSVRDVLKMVGARNTAAVQVGGPSGELVGPEGFDRILSYSDLSTGGSLIVIGESRDILRDVILNFTDFFISESCGSCVPCRTVPIFLRQKLEAIIEGRAVPKDLEDIQSWSALMKVNRCGLGHTAANPILTGMRNLPALFQRGVQDDTGFNPAFHLTRLTGAAARVTGREPAKEED